MRKWEDNDYKLWQKVQKIHKRFVKNPNERLRFANNAKQIKRVKNKIEIEKKRQNHKAFLLKIKIVVMVIWKLV